MEKSNMSAFTSVGKIVVVKEEQYISATFKKREFVLGVPSDNPDYKPETVIFEVVNDKCDVLDSFQIDQEVEVSWNLKGRKWVSPSGEDRYFNTLKCWKINATSQQQAPPAAYQQAPQPSFDDTPNSQEVPF